MTRSFSRFSLADGLALLGIVFGTWLIHQAFQPSSDWPQTLVLLIGGTDILLCCGVLGYLLRLRLQEGQRLPRSWIVASVILITGLWGWIAALFLDAERLRADLQVRQQTDQHLAQLDDAVRQFQHLLPSAGTPFDRKRWDLVHDLYARAHDQLHTFLLDKSAWDKELAQIHAEVAQLHQVVTTPLPDPRSDAAMLRDRAQQQLEKLRAEITQGEQELIATHRVRWHGVGSAALTGVFLLLGGVLMWLVFDRELRRRLRAQARLAAAEAHFRSLVEHQPDALATLDASANLLYTNAAWQTDFHYQPDDLEGCNLLELIHPEDRPQVQQALQQQDPQHAVPCRLSADYGIWHDVEMHCQKHADEQIQVVRFHHLRETADTPAAPEAVEEPSILKLPDPLHAHDLPALAYLYDPAARQFVSVSNLPAAELGYAPAAAKAPAELLMSLVHPEDEARVFRPLGLRAEHQEDAVAEDEIRLRDADGNHHWYAVYHRSLPAGRDRAQRVAGVAFPIQRHKRAVARAEELRVGAEHQLQALTEVEQQARIELRRHQWLAGAHQDAAADGVLILSSQAEVLSWNSALVRMWNLPTESAASRSWLTIAMHLATQVESGWEEFRQAVADHEAGRKETGWELVLKDGRTIEATAQALPEGPQHAGAVLLRFGDITRDREWEATHHAHREKHGHLQKALREHEEQRKSHETALRDHEKYRQTHEAALREHEEHRRSHESALRDHEHRRTHLEKSLRDREEDCRKLEADLREREEHGRTTEQRLRERERHHEEMESTLRDHQDRLHDLHRTHEGHARSLQASKEAIRRLASGVANDFNKILSVVLGYTDVLRESFPRDHMAQNYVDEMRQAANHGAELTQKLLAFSRNHLLQMIPVDLNQQLAALEAKIQTALGHEVRVHWERATEELWVKTDPHPLEQALLHLFDHTQHRLQNGGQHGGTLTIRTRRLTLAKKDLTHADMAPGSYVEMRLQDHGSDMDEDTRRHLFEPYYPAREGHKSDLGLATANGIIRQSGGCIDVESTPGQGNEIVILLPWTDERPSAAAVA